MYASPCIFDQLRAGLVGLAISYALSVTGLLSGVVTSFTETEKQMVSVERAMQYITGVPSERDTGIYEVCVQCTCLYMIKINEPQLSWLRTAIYHTGLDVKM